MTAMPPTTNHRLHSFQRAAPVQGHARQAGQPIHRDRHARRKLLGAGVRMVDPCRGPDTCSARRGRVGLMAAYPMPEAVAALPGRAS